MKSILRTILAFAAGAGLILLLLLITKEVPSTPPEPLGASPTGGKPLGGEAAASRPVAPASAPVPARQRTPAEVDADREITSTSSLTTPVRETPASPRPGGAITGLGGRFQAKPGSKVRIEGTSNIHDWQVEGNIIGGQVELGTDFPLDPARAQPGKVEAHAQVSIPSRSLKSVTADSLPFNAQMDSIMYGKLLEQTYKSVQYKLSELILTEVPQGAGEPFIFESKGELMVAGVTNAVAMPIRMTMLPDDKLKFSGSVSLKMTEFGIQPPEPPLLGIKTGDDVKLIFDWVVGRKKP
jgi:hypothetical protein